jgi:predicted lactoylglutathione lyase
MARQLYVNLPVKNLQATNHFFTELGFTFNPQFTDEKASCMIINDDAYFMFLQEDFFKTFLTQPLSNAFQQTEVLNCISAQSRDAVNEMVDKAVALGAKENRQPMDYGFMFQRSFQDLDGHIWEVNWMDMSQFPVKA